MERVKYRVFRKLSNITTLCAVVIILRANLLAIIRSYILMGAKNISLVNKLLKLFIEALALQPSPISLRTASFHKQELRP